MPYIYIYNIKEKRPWRHEIFFTDNDTPYVIWNQRPGRKPDESAVTLLSRLPLEVRRDEANAAYFVQKAPYRPKKTKLQHVQQQACVDERKSLNECKAANGNNNQEETTQMETALAKCQKESQEAAFQGSLGFRFVPRDADEPDLDATGANAFPADILDKPNYTRAVDLTNVLALYEAPISSAVPLKSETIIQLLQMVDSAYERLFVAEEGLMKQVNKLLMLAKGRAILPPDAPVLAEQKEKYKVLADKIMRSIDLLNYLGDRVGRTILMLLNPKLLNQLPTISYPNGEQSPNVLKDRIDFFVTEAKNIERTQQRIIEIMKTASPIYKTALIEYDIDRYNALRNSAYQISSDKSLNDAKRDDAERILTAYEEMVRASLLFRSILLPAILVWDNLPQLAYPAVDTRKGLLDETDRLIATNDRVQALTNLFLLEALPGGTTQPTPAERTRKLDILQRIVASV